MFFMVLLCLFGIIVSSVVWFHDMSPRVFLLFKTHGTRKINYLCFLKCWSVFFFFKWIREYTNEFFQSIVWNYFPILHLWDLNTFLLKMQNFLYYHFNINTWKPSTYWFQNCDCLFLKNIQCLIKYVQIFFMSMEWFPAPPSQEKKKRNQ